MQSHQKSLFITWSFELGNVKSRERSPEITDFCQVSWLPPSTVHSSSLLPAQNPQPLRCFPARGAREGRSSLPAAARVHSTSLSTNMQDATIIKSTEERQTKVTMRESNVVLRGRKSTASPAGWTCCWRLPEWDPSDAPDKWRNCVCIGGIFSGAELGPHYRNCFLRLLTPHCNLP